MGVTITNLLRILVVNKFRVNWRFLPRTLFISLTAIFNIPFHLLEYGIYNSRIKKQVVKEPVFIIGHPRSGTTHLFNLMVGDERFGYCNTLHALLPNNYLITGRFFRKLIVAALPKHRPQDNVQLTIDSPKEEEFALSNMSQSTFMHAMFFPKNAKMHFNESVLFTDDKSKRNWQKHYSAFVGKLSFSEKKRLLLKSPANLARIKEILEMYPDAKFIHIHRDPQDVYNSTEHMYEKIVPMTSFHHADNSRMEDYVFYSYRAMFEKFFDASKELNNDQLVSVSYKDLELNPMNTIEKIYDQLKLVMNEDVRSSIGRKINDVKDYQKNKYSQITKQQIDRINEEWGEMFKKLGYDAEFRSSADNRPATKSI